MTFCYLFGAPTLHCGWIAMPEFYLRVMGENRAISVDVEMECDTEEDAFRIAHEVRTPFGHELRSGERFLGRFERAWTAYPRIEDDGEDAD
jgi:hypothetical protein